MRSLTKAAALILATSATIGCSSLEDAGPRTLPAGAAYVSMGSSFAAGAGIGPLQEGSPQRCSRTTNNYASLLAERLELVLIDTSCSGATTEHVISRWDELGPQIDAVNEQTRLVTITVGGNDLGYVANLFAGSCGQGVALTDGPCKPVIEPTEADYAKLEARLKAISAEVFRRSPRSRLIFVQYLTLLSADTCGLETISEKDAALAREVARRLSQSTRRAALESGAEVLAIDLESKAHAPCSAEPWSFGFPSDHDWTKGTPWHPNAVGHAQIAKSLFNLIDGR